MLINAKVIAAAATMVLLATGAGVVSGATPALASPGHPALASSGHQVCDEGLPLECLNAWNGGPSIRTYTPTVSNNNFTIQGVNRCNNGDYTTSNCPISGNPSGLYIYQIKYAGGGRYNGYCLGDNTGNLPSYAQMVGCNNTSYPGTGGGTATIFVAFPGDGNLLPYCDSGFNWGINSHWTNLSGGWWPGLSGISYSDVNDVQVVLSNLPDNCLSYTPFG
jgi:hypothetical protein